MSVTSPHNKIISSTARTLLRPLGVQQKGRSRFWYDDRRWHAISIEFQPSSFSKGSYLNVAITWLWYPKSFWSFDESSDQKPWVVFHNEAQFQEDFEALVKEVIKEVHNFRAKFGSLKETYEIVLERRKDMRRPGGWPDVHQGLLAALCGHPARADELLGYVARQECEFDWQLKQKAFCKTAVSLLEDVDGLRAWVENNIGKGRSLLGLPVLEPPFLPAR